VASELARRKAQNKGVKAGTVRVGAKGKTVRRYNAKTGRWDVTKKDVKATGTTLRPVKSSTATTSTGRPRGGYAGGPTSYSPPAKTVSGNKKYSNLTVAQKSGEGPKVSRTSNYSRVGFRTPGSNKSVDKVITNKPSDFKKNGSNPRLQLVKQRSKDSKGRDVYRWVEVKSPRK
jgi:hypothetical protein